MHTAHIFCLECAVQANQESRRYGAPRSVPVNLAKAIRRQTEMY